MNNRRLNWENIVRSDGGSTTRGTKFEDLIENLLTAMYGEKMWRRTQASHDGKKDFAAPYEYCGRDTHWAECKNYDVRISINTLSPTLVMSAIENIPNIIFFSFSELNNNAYNYTSKFASLYNKNITIYDGIILENLIYQYRDSIKNITNFFPDIYQDECSFTIEQNNYKLYKFLRRLDGKTIISTDYMFEIGEKFRYVIVIHNISLTELNIVVNTNLYEKNIRINPVSLNKTISFGEVCEISFECEIITYKPSFSIPSIEITINDKDFVISKLTDVHSIPVPYCFFCGSSHFKVLNSITSLLTDGTTAPMIIDGPSGVGKSTIINNILNNNDVCSKYQIIYFDGDEKANNVYNIVKDLLFQMVGIKYFTNDEYVNEAEETFLINNFYMSDSLDIYSIINAIIKLSKMSKILFFIDNTNNLNPQLVRILNVLFVEVSRCNLWNQLSFVLTVNTSVSSISDILKLLNIDEAYADFKINHLTLEEFTRDDAILYFESKYGMQDVSLCFDDDNNETYLPLFLDYFFKYMVDNKTIIFNNNQNYIINKPIEFRVDINNLNKSDTKILKEQESMLFTKYSNFKSEIEWIIKLLLLLDEINLDNFIWLNKRAIQILCDYNIIKITNKILTFRHNKIYQYYHKSIITTPKEYINMFYELHRTSQNDFMVEKIICIFASNCFNQIQECHQILSDFFESKPIQLSYDKVFIVCNTMVRWLKIIDESSYIPITVTYLKNNLKPLTNYIGRENIFGLYKYMVDVFVNDKFLKWEAIHSDICFIYKKFLDLILNHHKNNICKKYVGKFRKQTKKFNGISIYEKNKWIAHYYNRLAIAVDRNSMPLSYDDNALKYYKLSRKYADQTLDNKLKEQIEIDEFNRHYFYVQDLSRQDILNLSNFYHEVVPYHSDDDLKAKFHIYLTDFLLKKECHIPDIDTILNNANPLYSSFYVSKFKMLRIYSILEKNDTGDLVEEIDNLLRYVYSSQLRHFIYKVTYIKAQYSRLKFGETNETLDLFIKAYQQLSIAMKNEAEKYRNIFLYRELLSYIYTKNKHITKKLVKDCTVSQAILNILKNNVKSYKNDHLLYTNSQFVLRGINYPNI
ncbi:MAG: hypothetical protein HFE52_03720 [Clostridia bacterium]|nr:hypothetical protein [Clostridia bacterium]